MHPKMKTGWFQKDVCEHLQQWYVDYCDGLRPVLILNTPPQHGKSAMIIDFVAWLLGHMPDKKFIYASFSERLSIRANLSVQRLLDNPKFAKVFPDIKLPKIGDKIVSRSREMLELVNDDGAAYSGSFRNTTVRGSITGESLDIGLIDDPIKGREQANSPTVREITWEWFTDDFFTRFSDSAGLISIATRWHVDDPIARLVKSYPESKVISYKAIAEKDEEHRKAGEALFPEHKSLEFLLIRKKMLSAESWSSLYQQNPIVSGGNLIKSEWMKRYTVLPRLKYMRIFVDTASKTKQMNDYTVFGLYGVGIDGGLYVVDILRGKWEYTPMKQRARDFWYKHAHTVIGGSEVPLRDLAVEDKSAGIQLIQDLRTEELIPVTDIQRSTDKYTRLMDVVGYISSGYVHVPEKAPWLNDFLSECEQFTGTGDTHDDQVDTLLDALKYMLADTRSSLFVWENLD